MLYNKEELLKLPVDEKISLLGDLWDSLDSEQANIPLSEWKKTLILKRIETDNANPTEGMPWSELRMKYFQE